MLINLLVIKLFGKTQEILVLSQLVSTLFCSTCCWTVGPSSTALQSIQQLLCLWYNGEFSFICSHSHTAIWFHWSNVTFYSDFSLILVDSSVMTSYLLQKFSLCSVHKYLFLKGLPWDINLWILRRVLTLRNISSMCFKTALYAINNV